MVDPFDLERFVVAQEPVIAAVLGELRAGRKASHWMWFVFPQVAGLGHSPMAQRYAISSLEEARAYLGHHVLGPRLRTCCHLLLEHPQASAEEILGPVDARKLHSSMSLFHLAMPGDPVFAEVLDTFFAGRPDAMTRGLVS